MSKEVLAELTKVTTIVTRIDERLQNHIENEEKHHVPACDELKELSERSWQVLMASAIAIISAFGALAYAVVIS